MDKLIFTAENGGVDCQGTSVIITPDVFGTWETVEDVLLTATIPETWEGAIVWEGNKRVVSPLPDDPEITSDKLRVIIEPIE